MTISMRAAYRTVGLAALLATTHASLAGAQLGGVRVFPVPVIGYAPETSWMFGAALVGVVSVDSTAPARRPSTLLATALYTLKHQYSTGLAVDHWTAGDRWHLSASISAERYPSQFNGLGPAATDAFEVYTPQRVTLVTSVLRRVAPHLYAGAGWAIRDARMISLDTAGRLASGTIPGSRGGTPAVLTLEGDWDSRDALYRPRRGAYLRLAWGVAGRAVGSDFAYRRYTADGRWFHALGARTVLAGQLVADWTDGTVPFDLLPHLGGEAILRGFTVPRYTDQAMGAAQVELRGPLKGILGYALFAGGGSTASRAGDLVRSTLRPAGGAGIRVLVDRKAGLQLRIDFASAPGGGGMYIGAGDAF